MLTHLQFSLIQVVNGTPKDVTCLKTAKQVLKGSFGNVNLNEFLVRTSKGNVPYLNLKNYALRKSLRLDASFEENKIIINAYTKITDPLNAVGKEDFFKAIDSIPC